MLDSGSFASPEKYLCLFVVFVFFVLCTLFVFSYGHWGHTESRYWSAAIMCSILGPLLPLINICIFFNLYFFVFCTLFVFVFVFVYGHGGHMESRYWSAAIMCSIVGPLLPLRNICVCIWICICFCVLHSLSICIWPWGSYGEKIYTDRFL